MLYKKQEVIDIVIKSCESLLDRYSYLLEKHINERTLTHRLAVYLEESFQEWHIDREYNMWQKMMNININIDSLLNL